jgi:hypothetical protein
MVEINASVSVGILVTRLAEKGTAVLLLIGLWLFS